MFSLAAVSNSVTATVSVMPICSASETGGAGFTVSGAWSIPSIPLESVARTVIVKLPLRVGVPLRTPLWLSSVRPGGAVAVK